MYMKRLICGLLFCGLALLTAACPSSSGIPSDGKQVEIEARYDYFIIKDGGVRLYSPVPRRYKDGKEILPVKAVEHKDRLYILWADDLVQYIDKPK